MKALTVVVVVSVTSIVLIAGMNAYASHYSGYRWTLPYTNVCYDSYSLNNVRIDGSTGRYSLVASEIDQARMSWNDLPSIFTINKVNSCNNWITAARYSSPTPQYLHS